MVSSPLVSGTIEYGFESPEQAKTKVKHKQVWKIVYIVEISFRLNLILSFGL